MGHTVGGCPSAGETVVHLRVYDTSGVHTLPVTFCDCIGAPSRAVQLLRIGWYPATVLRPRTVFTFDVLSTFQELNLQGKTTVHDWYHTLLRKTDGAGLGSDMYGEKEMARVVRQWRNLMALKRGGRAHDPSGVSGTALGALAVECPACPQPGRNLPVDWKDVLPSLKFLYTLFVSLDANFRLGGKQRNLKDVTLSDGWHYYVERAGFDDHIKKFGNQKEVCSLSFCRIFSN